MEIGPNRPDDEGEPIPIQGVGADELEAVLDGLDERARRFVRAQAFKAEAGRHVVIPDAKGNIGCVLLGLGGSDAAERRPLLAGKLAPALPPGTYRLAAGFDEPALSALAFALGGYRFERYRAARNGVTRLAQPAGSDATALARIRDGIFRYCGPELPRLASGEPTPMSRCDSRYPHMTWATDRLLWPAKVVGCGGGSR